MSKFIRNILESSKPKQAEAGAPKLNMPTLKLPKAAVTAEVDQAVTAIAGNLIATTWTTATAAQKKQAQDRLEVVKSFHNEAGHNYLLQTSFDLEEGGLEESPVGFLVTVTQHGGTSVNQTEAYRPYAGLTGGSKVKFVNPTDFPAADWGLDQDAYEEMLKHEGQIATITSVNIEGDDPDEGYFSIEFPDGYSLEAVSGYHFVPISGRTEAKDSADAQIQAIFAKHNITADPGLEGFWDAVDQVAAIDMADGDELERLADEWDGEQVDGNTPADKAFEAAKDLRPAIEQMLDSIAAICQSIDAELGNAMAPGLQSAVISALRKGTADPAGSKFNLDVAKTRVAEYYEQHEKG